MVRFWVAIRLRRLDNGASFVTRTKWFIRQAFSDPSLVSKSFPSFLFSHLLFLLWRLIFSFYFQTHSFQKKPPFLALVKKSLRVESR
ncbi:hypothetical protein M408DRAFT_167971 [Serendipita vermifera MAFF 305830]|uniref:Uncharacterized protein n=1 Tax=Serendipita vermifera MAFF 305830 TaxID=933852 RepID=A0A0C3ASV8_SERVB|nr:hypothetical protein M408DRAFT_167971 [Serendipita vermifera MAFF 305830]